MPMAIEKIKISIFIFSIVLGAKYSSFVKSNATFALTSFKYIISVLASVTDQVRRDQNKNKKQFLMNASETFGNFKKLLDLDLVLDPRVSVCIGVWQWN